MPLASGTPATDPRRVRRAVLVGVGEARNHPSSGDAPTDAVTLMTVAARAAAEDAGAPALLDAVGLLAATVGSDDAPDPAGAVRAALDLPGAATMVAAVGVPQQRLVSNAVLAVETGAAEAVLLLGGEAKASSLAAGRAGLDAPDVRQGPGADVPLLPEGEFMAQPEVAASLWDPVTQYALIDSALARVEGRTPAELRNDVSELWARFDAVAAGNPDACFAGPRSAADLAATSEGNRLLAFPYNKWHSTQWALDHAAALLVCADDVAARHGVPPEGRLHPQVALDTSWGLSLSRRAEVHRWPTMGQLGEATAQHLGAPVVEVSLAELYSCFPAAVRVQQRELRLPPEGAPTVLGGMAFAGGPFNHFTYMATAELARLLRAGDADRAMVTTVSGLLTKGGVMVWGREPHGDGALVADLAGRAEAATGTREVAPFDPQRRLAAGDTVVAATITGGFDPTLFVLAEDRAGTRHVLAQPAPDGDPADALAALG